MAAQDYGPVFKSEDLTSGSTSPRYALGTKVRDSGNEYTYVYNDGGANILTGQYCVLKGVATSYTSGYSVTVTNASLAGWMAGVPQNTMATATYMFIMTKGVSYGVPDSGGTSANVGVDLSLGTDGGWVAAGATFSTSPRFAHTLNSFVTTVGTGRIRLFNSIL